MKGRTYTAAALAVLAVMLSSALIPLSSADTVSDEGNEAAIGGTEYPTLQDALDAAQDGDTIRLLRDVDLAGDRNNPGASIKTGVTIDGNDLNGGMFTISSESAYNVLEIRTSDIDHVVTLKNVEIRNDSGLNNSRCLYSNGLTAGLVLDNVSMVAEEGGNTQPLTISGDEQQLLTVEIRDSSIRSSSSGYSIICFAPVDMTISGSELEGWATIYMKDNQDGGGSEGSHVMVVDSSIKSINKFTGDSNDFSAIVCEDVGIDISLVDVNVTVGETEGNNQCLFSSNLDGEPGRNSFSIGGDKTEVTFIGNTSMMYVSTKDAADCEITGGKFTGIDIDELAAFIPSDKEIVVNPDGSFGVSSADTDPDDGDEFVPPHIPSDNGTSTTVLVAACAAAAVAAAIAIVLVASERKR